MVELYMCNTVFPSHGVLSSVLSFLSYECSPLFMITAPRPYIKYNEVEATKYIILSTKAIHLKNY